MREGFPGLVHAVQTALGHELDPDSVEDRTLLYDGCFLLNHWGVEPRYRYGQYLLGPFSSELRGDYTELVDGGIPLVDTVPPRYVSRLAGILNGGSDFLLAHLTVALVIEHNPGITMGDAIRLCSRIEPGISDLITEVVSSWER